MNLQTDRGLAFCVVENISEGGLFVRTNQPLPLDTPVTLSLARPGIKRALKVKGKIVNAVSPEQAAERRTAPGMGIKFDPMRADDCARLAELLGELNTVEAKVATQAPRPEHSPRSLARSIDRASIGVDVADGALPVVPHAASYHRTPAPPPAKGPAVLMPSAPARAVAVVDAGGAENARLLRLVSEAQAALAQLQARFRETEAENATLRAELEQLRQRAPIVPPNQPVTQA